MRFLPKHVFDVSLACAKNIKKYRSFFMLFVMGPYGAILTQGAKWIKLEDRQFPDLVVPCIRLNRMMQWCLFRRNNQVFCFFDVFCWHVQRWYSWKREHARAGYAVDHVVYAHPFGALPQELTAWSKGGGRAEQKIHGTRQTTYPFWLKSIVKQCNVNGTMLFI